MLEREIRNLNDQIDALRKQLGEIARRPVPIDAKGTWLPVITGSSSNPTVTYTTQSGRWTQHEDVIHYSFTVQIATISGGSGAVRISLPFTPVRGGPAAYYADNIDLPGTPVGGVFYALTSGAFGLLVEKQDNAASQNVQVSGLAAGDVIEASGHFYI